MVERRILTPDFVEAATPPSRGERWVSDTKLRGFGLRLWATKFGGQKAFAIRVSDRDGHSIRKTFSPHNTAALRRSIWSGEFDYRLGEHLVDARVWARDEIDRLKGRPTVLEEDMLRRQVASARVKTLTLQTAAQSIITGMSSRGLSQAYIDRVDKLFALHIPTKLQETPLCEISPDVVANVLVDVAIPPGNIRILKSFVGQIYERAALFYGPLGRFPKEMSEDFWAKWEARYDVPFPELRHLTEADYQRVFERLEAETTMWQQALCIRLFFEFGAPLSQLMAAQWVQILKGTWFPYWPNQRVFWFESREPIDDQARSLLDCVSHYVRRDFDVSRYWFPSRFGRKAEHIRTVDTVWRYTLHDIGSRYYPLRDFALSYRRPNNPSYLISFLRQYGPTFRVVGNMANLSKELDRRKNLDVK